MTPLTRDVFDGATAERRLCDYFAVATMDGFGALSRLEATAAAAAVTYIDRTQVGKRPPLSPPAREATGTTMAIDPATRANLELTRTLVRRTARLAARRDRPHRHRRRLAAAGAAARSAADRHRARSRGGSMRSARSSPTARHARTSARTLRGAPDMSRALARLAVGRGGPRDLAALRDGILAADQALATCSTQLDDAAGGDRQRVMDALRRPSRELAREFQRALADELPLLKRDGGFVARRL